MNLKTLSAKLNNAFDILSDSGITIIPAGIAMAEASLEAELAEAQEARDNAAPADTPTGERGSR